MPPVYWLNINDPGYPFLAAVEHTNMMPAGDYGGRHLLYLGNYLPMDHRYFKQPDAEVIAEFLPHLNKINPAFDPVWVTRAWVFKAPFAQPVVTREYRGAHPAADHADPQPLPGATCSRSTPRTGARTTACAWPTSWPRTSRSRQPTGEPQLAGSALIRQTPEDR